MIRLPVLLLVAFLSETLLAPSVRGQNIPESFTPFLNARDLREMDMDGQGGLWIASNGGALRFELTTGRWEVYPRLLGTGPRGNDLVTTCVDDAGRVWVGSATHGFTFYDPLTRIWDRESEEWPDPRIRVIRCLNGGIYIGTEGGLSLKPAPNRTDICAASDPGCIVPSYIVNDYAMLGDTLWVATEGGLGRFNGSTWDSAGALPAGSIGQRSRSLAAFAGSLWEVTFDRRIRRLVNGSWQSIAVPVSRLAATGGNLYAFGVDERVFRFDGSSWVDLNVPLSPGEVVRDVEVVGQDMYLALNGSLGLWRGGGALENRFYPPGPHFNGTYSALAGDSRGRLWAGTSEQAVGLTWYDQGVWEGTPRYVDNLGEGWLLGMFRSSDDAIWLGHCCCSDPGLCALQRRESDAIVTFVDVLNAWAFAEDASHRIWYGSRGLGVFVRDPGTEALEFNLTLQNTGGALGSNNVTAVAVTSSNTYIGTEASGLDVWRHGGDLTQGRDGTGWVHIGVNSLGLLDESVESMQFRDGDLWVATASGLHRLTGIVVQERCPARDRLTSGDPIHKVNAIAADRLGGLWLATDNGLLYHPRGGACDEAGGDFQIFTTENSPLPGDRVVSAVQNPGDGSMWFGTVGGLLRVDPLRFTGSPPPPDRFVLYPNPVFPASDNAQARRVFFGIERSGIRIEPVSAGNSTQPRVYDLAGRYVGDFELVNVGTAGSWVWRATNTNGDTVAPGIYVVRSDVDGEPVSLKLGVVR